MASPLSYIRVINVRSKRSMLMPPKSDGTLAVLNSTSLISQKAATALSATR